MQTSISQAEISRIPTSELHALIRDLEYEMANAPDAAERTQLEGALRSARSEIARRQLSSAPKPPGF